MNPLPDHIQQACAAARHQIPDDLMKKMLFHDALMQQGSSIRKDVCNWLRGLPEGAGALVDLQFTSERGAYDGDFSEYVTAYVGAEKAMTGQATTLTEAVSKTLA